MDYILKNKLMTTLTILIISQTQSFEVRSVNLVFSSS